MDVQRKGLVCSGLLNKQIAYQLQLSQITVKVHRGKVPRQGETKMQAHSLPELVRFADRLATATKA